ncbi:MAG TPA: tetratricopeptide repeat protein, partial [Myxococcaceae bacterium]|nr:tetratricopeptide repeat protein [Myxococcaceae bacterium]
LSAPIPSPPSAPAGNSDGLEMLSFIDDAGKDAGASKSKVKRFHVRRRSGKVFGPFEEGVVVKMLEDGQLLGNEDVSPDGESWAGMSTVPLFAQTIQKLMEAPSTGGSAAPTIPPPMMGETSGPAASGPQQAAATMDRLKQLYEGRMAAVSVVDRPDPFAAVKKRLPLVIAAGVAVLVLGIGFSFGFTRYGAFGMKKLLPAKLSQGDTGYAELQNAKKALSADTFKSYKEARDLTAKVLAGKEYPEARAVWAQAIFYLQRRYAAATPAEVAQANASLEHVEMLGTKHVEVAKAFAGAALAKKQPDQALVPLKEAKSRAENDKDSELDLLLAEALEQKRDAKGAKDALAKVIARDPKSAKAQHALGNLHQAASDADNAVKAYQAALDADPDHVISAVELAAVELLIGKDVEGGIKALEKATGEKVKSLLGPAELARARSLMGVALAEQFKPKEAIVAFDEAIKLDANSAFTKAMMGRVLLAQRDYEKALPLLKEAQERDPNKLDYTDGYISALLALGKLSDAVKAVDEGNKRFPSNARIAYLQGRVHEGADKQAEAETSYKRALASDAKLYEANLALARLYLSLKRVVDARAQMEPAYARAPNDALVRTGMGELYLAEKDFAKAEEEFKKAAELNPTLAETHLGLSRVSLSKGELDAALAEVDRAIELDKNVKEGRLQRGVVLWKKGDLDNALKELEAAKAVDPKNSRIAVVTGAVQFDRGNLPDAEKNLLTAISSDSTNAEPHFYLAQVRAKRLEYTQAIDNMKNALERAPKRPDYHYQMGIIYRDAKRLPEAIDSWKAVLKLDPNHADAHEAMGQAYLERSRLDDAIASFDLALKADPKRTRIEAFVADCYFQAAKWNDAIARYKDALKDDASLVHVYYKIGRAYSEQGKHKDAVSWYQKATDVEKDNPMPYYYLGYLYKEKGKRREAVTAFKAYLERKPNAEDKREIEDEIFDLSQ